MTEAQLQQAVIELAQTCGWCVAHFRPAMTSLGWRTAVAADGTGFPDLVLAHPGRGVIYAELKSAKGRLAVDQLRWRDVLIAAGATWRLWRPDDWDSIVHELSGGHATPTIPTRTGAHP